MRKIIIILGVMVLTLFYSMPYAQEVALEIYHPKMLETSLLNNVPETNTQYDDLGSSVLVYSLIIGVYALYWLRQKA